MFFLDSLWNETKQGKHKYYRIIDDYYNPNTLHLVRDYYQNDTLQMKGYSSSAYSIIKEGTFFYYYQNGKKKSMVNYQENKKVGKEYKWYENGNKEYEGEYILNNRSETSVFIINQFWDINGQQKVIDGNGDYEENENDTFAFGKVINGLKSGEWKGEFKKLKISYTENYKDGNLISGVSVDSLNNQHYYEKIIVQPKPRKGMSHFYEFVGKKFKFTKNSEGKGGKIFITFYIDKNGKATDFNIIRGLGFGLDEEAIRVISKYPEWECGYYRGIGAKFLFYLPISIKPL